MTVTYAWRSEAVWQLYRFVASSANLVRTAPSWWTGWKYVGVNRLQIGQRSVSETEILSVRYDYRGAWKDVYIGDACSSADINLEQGNVQAEEVLRCRDTYRCLSLPGAKICIHYRPCDLEVIGLMSCPEGVPSHLWRCLQHELTKLS